MTSQLVRWRLSARRGARAGERAFQVRDPNGVIIELLDWKAATG
jgi:hypothetical protein